jgi:hypothetical protein
MSAARRIAASIFALASVLAPVAAAQAAPASELYYERVLMRAAGDRCRLFGPELTAALDAAAAQARGAALRAGTAAQAVDATRERAFAKASGVDCRSQDLATAAARVRSAFAGLMRTAHMTYPGEEGAWSADRTAYRSVAWALEQRSTAGGARAEFGLAGRGGANALIATLALADGERPYAARLVYRDRARAPLPWVGAPNNRLLPPRTASKALLAEASSPCEPQLSPDTNEDARAFRFPAAAADELAGLDPRERFAVEFLLPNGRVLTARFEVGDFVAGRAFLRLGPL